MPADFDMAQHGLRKLAVTQRNGVVFASFGQPEPFEEYLGPKLTPLFDRIFDGRELKVLGYSRQLTPANWKLMCEHIKDAYHAGLLHVFLLSFGLNRTVDHPRIARKMKGGPRTYHVVNIRVSDEVDDQVKEWLTESYMDFAP
jgi:salicylate 5-hydroxylase large subunit